MVACKLGFVLQCGQKWKLPGKSNGRLSMLNFKETCLMVRAPTRGNRKTGTTSILGAIFLYFLKIAYAW